MDKFMPKDFLRTLKQMKNFHEFVIDTIAPRGVFEGVDLEKVKEYLKCWDYIGF